MTQSLDTEIAVHHLSQSRQKRDFLYLPSQVRSRCLFRMFFKGKLKIDYGGGGIDAPLCVVESGSKGDDGQRFWVACILLFLWFAIFPNFAKRDQSPLSL